MRAARLYGVGDIRVADEPTPEVGPGEALVQVSAVGLCGSDLHWFSEGAIGGEPARGVRTVPCRLVVRESSAARSADRAGADY